MATKKRTSGFQQVPACAATCELQYTNGTIAKFLRGTQASFQRRFGVDETITSETGDDGRFRPCYHQQSTWTARPLGILVPYLYGGIYATTPVNGSTVKQAWIRGLEYDIHARRYSNFLNGVSSVSASLATVQWSALSATALQTMLPTFHGKNSLVNFVIELKDFKHVLEALGGKITKNFSFFANLLGL